MKGSLFTLSSSSVSKKCVACVSNILDIPLCPTSSSEANYISVAPLWAALAYLGVVFIIKSELHSQMSSFTNTLVREEQFGSLDNGDNGRRKCVSFVENIQNIGDTGRNFLWNRTSC